MATHLGPKSEHGPLAGVDRELAVMFDRHASFVWRVLQLLGVPRSDVDDALQEVFLIVLRKLPEYEERGGAKAWLFTIARQVASHARRATQRRLRRERGDELAPGAPEDPHSALERSEATRFVEAFLSKLDERQATVFHLAEVEGMSAPEIADCLGVGVNTVYGRLRLAREQFERALQRQRGQELRWNR
ncbi:MAG: sigma-70 family RNA polymerase sigma factor [Polyangiales bacterium]